MVEYSQGKEGDFDGYEVKNRRWKEYRYVRGQLAARVVSPHGPTLEGVQVAALIDPNTHTWNVNLLHQHFLSFEANRIKAIPL